MNVQITLTLKALGVCGNNPLKGLVPPCLTLSAFDDRSIFGSEGSRCARTAGLELANAFGVTQIANEKRINFLRLSSRKQIRRRRWLISAQRLERSDNPGS